MSLALVSVALLAACTDLGGTNFNAEPVPLVNVPSALDGKTELPSRVVDGPSELGAAMNIANISPDAWVASDNTGDGMAQSVESLDGWPCVVLVNELGDSGSACGQEDPTEAGPILGRIKGYTVGANLPAEAVYATYGDQFTAIINDVFIFKDNDSLPMVQLLDGDGKVLWPDE